MKWECFDSLLCDLTVQAKVNTFKEFLQVNCAASWDDEGGEEGVDDILKRIYETLKGKARDMAKVKRGQAPAGNGSTQPVYLHMGYAM
jgi:hypothetical protein